MQSGRYTSVRSTVPIPIRSHIEKGDRFACVDTSTAINAHAHVAAHAKEASWLREIRICDMYLRLIDVEERLIDVSAGKDKRMHLACVRRELMNAAQFIIWNGVQAALQGVDCRLLRFEDTVTMMR